MQADRLILFIEALAYWRNALAEDEESELAADARDLEAQAKIRYLERRAAEENHSTEH